MNEPYPASVATWLQWAVQQLAGGDSPRADAEVLLAAAWGKSRAWLLAWGGQPVPVAVATTFRHWVLERQRGMPVAYLLGRRSFWTLELQVTPATLIPRPETELLVETALPLLPAAARVLDLGTGSGALALSLAKERPDSQVVASDISPAALAVAQANARRHDITNVQFVQADWFAGLPPQRFDVIVTNPPYVAAGDAHLQQGDVRFEPRMALVAGHDGLAAIRQIVSQAAAWLVPGGWLLLEHGYDQGEAVTTLLRTHGFHAVRCLHDCAGNARVGIGCQSLDTE